MYLNLLEKLAILKINKIVVFNTDHFEPWKTKKGNLMDHVFHRVEEYINKSKFCKLMNNNSLFYKSILRVKELYEEKSENNASYILLENDRIGFEKLNKKNRTNLKIKKYMTKLFEETNNDLHIHMHHERFTKSKYFSFRKELCSCEKTDSMRFDLALKLAKERINWETNKNINDFCFIHGNWALNASDKDICNITDELLILKRNGCKADFTFPSPNKNLDPRIKIPYMINPINKIKCYDLALKKAEFKNHLNYGDKNKILIWNQRIPYKYCSLDYLTLRNTLNVINEFDVISAFIEGGNIIKKTLFIKFHSHSMSLEYLNKNHNKFPFEYDLILNINYILSKLCNALDIDLSYYNVSQVLECII